MPRCCGLTPASS